MHYNPYEPSPISPDPYKACVAPRAIAWVSTISKDGVCNIAPFSQFMSISFDPPMVALAINQKGNGLEDGKRKDTLNNIEETGCFVYNVATEELKDAMNLTGFEFKPEEDEFEAAGLHKADSVCIKAPRIAESPIQYECEHIQTIHYAGAVAGGKRFVDLVIAKVVQVHVADEYIMPDGKVDYAKLRLLGRAGYWDYTVMDDTFSMRIPGATATTMAAMEGRRPNEADAKEDAQSK